MNRNEYGILLEEDDEELVCRQQTKVTLPAGFEISIEEAEKRIVYCKRCLSNHPWLKCLNPVIN